MSLCVAQGNTAERGMPLHAPWIRGKAEDHKSEEKGERRERSRVYEALRRTIYQSGRRSGEKGFPREEKEGNR
ncbi:hypothetical protein BPOR_1634g00010 [Botrytis porri]|uniref:Uncharacterized protein n=1 Tax=Botrytis porri TaxID=87229 RepID=A0A4Z1K5P3_9HELO|nr:hypothetical protein BPOR_1634g00010 [Botrytis porri]